MCMVAYIGSRVPLPLVPWRDDAPGFNVTELTEHEVVVAHHLSLPHLRQAGSHTSCGCGFNEGRQYPEVYDDAASERVMALESSAKLVRYVRENRVEQIYSCWSGEEAQPREHERWIRVEDLVAPDFFFRERELLHIADDGA